MTWRVARSLDGLLNEINAVAPNRSKASDGSIGDAAHASRTSDHNPWVKVGGVGIVRARDFTDDPPGGLDCWVLASHLADMLRAGTHPALGSGAYVIWQRRIISRDRIGEGWREYTGSNPHNKHLHLSVATAAAGFDSLAPWGWETEEDPMATYAEQLDQIQTEVTALRKDVRTLTDATRRRDTKVLEVIRRRFNLTDADLAEIKAEVDR